MRRAMVFLTFLACTATLGDIPDLRAAKARPVMNGIGLINYARTRPEFTPGDWVKYRVTGSNSEGDQDDYFVTVFIAGEERFWGEDCFWVETRTQMAGAKSDMAVATLMSFSIFGDSLAIPRMKLFMRKTITDVNEDGTPREDLTKRPPITLRNRKPPGEKTAWTVDTVGVDTVNTPRGLYTCKMVKMEEGIAASSDRGDSSTRTEVRDTRTVYYAEGIPITAFAREHIVNTVHRKTWLIGRSSEGEMKLIARSEGNARLIDWGSGMTSVLVPQKFQKTLRAQDAATSTASRPKGKRAS